MNKKQVQSCRKSSVHIHTQLILKISPIFIVSFSCGVIVASPGPGLLLPDTISHSSPILYLFQLLFVCVWFFWCLYLKPLRVELYSEKGD